MTDCFFDISSSFFSVSVLHENTVVYQFCMACHKLNPGGVLIFAIEIKYIIKIGFEWEGKKKTKLPHVPLRFVTA